MKTNTYLRWSLLIPFLVWGVSLLIFMVISKFSPEAFPGGESLAAVDIAILFLAFYVFGIIVWILPYILLALILFFWSFIARTQTALKVFALSPIAMTLLTLAALTLLSFGTSEPGTIFSSAGIVDRDFLSLNILGAAFALIWGYICVGIGYGIYRLFQRRQLIRDEANIEAPLVLHDPA
jgi:hypothetical protein